MVSASGLELGEGELEDGGEAAAAEDVDGEEEEEHADSKEPTTARKATARSPRIHPPQGVTERRAVQD
jgi:hypothetical protein